MGMFGLIMNIIGSIKYCKWPEDDVKLSPANYICLIAFHLYIISIKFAFFPIFATFIVYTDLYYDLWIY